MDHQLVHLLVLYELNFMIVYSIIITAIYQIMVEKPKLISETQYRQHNIL